MATPHPMEWGVPGWRTIFNMADLNSVTIGCFMTLALKQLQ